MEISEILLKATQAGSSDIHIVSGMPPIIRQNTELVMMKEYGDISHDTAWTMLQSFAGERVMATLSKQLDADFATTIENGTRFRVNAHFQKCSIAIAFRAIQSTVPHIDNLGLPEVVKKLTNLPRGLVLVTGPTGSGKSTTLASMIDQINRNTAKHIITIEDPIEYDMISNACVIEQREIGQDCPSFASGLKHSLRQDPDVILVGEMRDLETTSATITAAETGHLVFSTLHTVNAAQTVERIIDIYPPGQQNQIRSMLANTLQAVISQTLCKRIDRPGMVACVEILLCNPAVRNCIRENRIFEINNILETSKKLGMQSLDQSIMDMLSKGYISEDDAIAKAKDPDKLRKTLLSKVPQLV
jgi:twitching motility protein PilT